jgi:hypothetical protein
MLNILKICTAFEHHSQWRFAVVCKAAKSRIFILELMGMVFYAHSQLTALRVHVNMKHAD